MHAQPELGWPETAAIRDGRRLGFGRARGERGGREGARRGEVRELDGDGTGFLSSKESKQGGRVEVARHRRRWNLSMARRRKKKKTKGKENFPNNPLGFEKIK